MKPSTTNPSSSAVASSIASTSSSTSNSSHQHQLSTYPTNHPQHQQSSSLGRFNDRVLTPNSPCFVHSHLDPGYNSDISHSMTRHERSRSRQPNPPPPVPQNPSHPSPTFSPKTPRPNLNFQSIGSMAIPDQQHSPHRIGNNGRRHDAPEQEGGYEYDDDDEEEESHESMTRQLAETATSVREISKQIGRTRIKAAIQSVLIITKARDNHLTRLTRELVISLARESLLAPISQQPTPSHELKPLVIYVDQQLRHSTRFDRAGLEKEFPDWFRPLSPQNKYKLRLSRSRSNSVSSISSMRSDLSSHSLASNSTTDSSPQDDGRLRYWTPEMCAKTPELFDLVITLGGDGTVLFASWLFQRIVPPIISFALGSLGFLTNFDYADHPKVLHEAIKLGVRINLRMRFSCTVYRASGSPVKRRAVRSGKTGEIFMNLLDKNGWQALENDSAPSIQRTTPCAAVKEDKEIACFSTYPAESFEVLNELVVDRGPSPYVSLLELFGDDHHMTTVQADGLTVSTPTGSTAYSLSAGGSLVHPEIPAMLITPICPHTLSFRPMLLPDTMELRICVPYSSRSTAWASFDGRGRVELRQGDHIKVTASAYPFPTVCGVSQSIDWFHSISRTLKWNERERQKSFVMIEEERGAASSSSSNNNKVSQQGQSVTQSLTAVPELMKQQEEFEEDEVEEYDIDDVTPNISLAKGLGGQTTFHNQDNQPELNPEEMRKLELHNLDPNHHCHSTSDKSSQGASTLKNSNPSSIVGHSRKISPKISNPNLKAFAVWGLDSSSSSDGSSSDS
ncbi:hypothetical protein MJO28_007456 [Puccinia striiformis f. sp. tritici]|uniref:NAD+ kinase n=3 Tax=Puccinia striiformis f. sp. tritici TaxID=168172 RepID=A0A0L0VW66_9BASI|nr:hypothetical protein Pst134EB_014556 [Puccinia striiformis f. sp. tritici]KAI7951772.1 hypothetical protein MJO28_007456 [Puccinia striiformis f. sp. tritici]KAI9603949.1 hypothetical protein H4Q26_003558 [Puccinia striiformis f. sp. tritici PST-130]KAI9612379.1 hypothetical protein KEM48_004110 [Puccinia striiformis f. sp. tritici PST-130]KNF03506.1 hypothetical protein PSTG_03442 [Puccinia striiformis f. sp. tritici PST-78]